jgi:MFS family permease
MRGCCARKGLAGHFVIANSWGWIISFGTWQTYYVQLLPDKSAFEISMIGSITVFLIFFIGTFTGRLTDAGYFRAVFITGSVLQILGIFCTSFCTEYWQFMLAQGLCIGLGNGFIFCPSLALISTYFLKRRSIAIGITASGSVLGGIIFPVMARQLLPKIGFPWTIRAIGFIQLGMIVVANILAKPRIKPRKSGPLVEFRAFLEMEYTFYAMAAFFVSLIARESLGWDGVCERESCATDNKG